MCAWGYIRPTLGNDKPDKLNKPNRFVKPEKSLPEKEIVTRGELKKAFMKVRDATRGGFGVHEHILGKYEKKTLAERLLPGATHHRTIKVEDLEKEFKKEAENLKHSAFDARRQGQSFYDKSKIRDYRKALDDAKRDLLGHK